MRIYGCWIKQFERIHESARFGPRGPIKTGMIQFP